MEKCVICDNDINVIREVKCERMLDGKPLIQKFVLKYDKCPKCGCINIDKSEIVPEALESETYKNASGYEAALILVKDHSTRAKICLNACWAAEFEGNEEEARKYRINAIREMVETLKETPIVNLGLICIDSFRQLGRFEDASILLDSIKENFEGKIFTNQTEYILLVFESQLIEKQDSNPYKIKDVKLI